jgi:hypothetical protein
MRTFDATCHSRQKGKKAKHKKSTESDKNNGKEERAER